MGGSPVTVHRTVIGDMTALDRGWMCNLCWTPNRAKDQLCLGCRRPRGATPAPRPARVERSAAEDDDLSIPTLLGVMVLFTVPLFLLDAGLRFFGGVELFTGAVDAGSPRYAGAGMRSVWFAVGEVIAAGAVLRGSRRAWFGGLVLSVLTITALIAMPSLIGTPLADEIRPWWWPFYVAGHAYIAIALLLAFVSEGIIRTRAGLRRS